MSRENMDINNITFPIELDPFLIQSSKEDLSKDAVDGSNGHEVVVITPSVSKQKLETLFNNGTKQPSSTQQSSNSDEIGKMFLII